MPRAAKSLSSAIHLLHRASQRADSLFARNVQDPALTPRQFAILQAVKDKSGLSQTDIMAATGIDRSSTAELVRRLVTNGWLQRRRTRRDSRIYAVRITPRGRELLEIGAAAPEKQRQAFLDVLTCIGGLARPMLRGAKRLGFKFTLTMAAYDLIRLPKLIGAVA